MTVIAILFALGAASALAQVPDLHPARPLALRETRYRLRAGEAVSIAAPLETLDFLRNAKARAARIDGTRGRGFAVGPAVRGDEVLLGASLTLPPGEYAVRVSAVSESGEEREATVNVILSPVATVPSTATKPPVVLLNGWQLGTLSNCPVSASSADTFGRLAQLLTSSGGVPVVYFFDNCVEDPNGPIEELGNTLGQVLDLIRYDTGAPAPQVDLIAHSMGGLIARAYLAGLQPDASLAPPLNPRVRKLITIATPHFGSFQAIPSLGLQATQMIPGSPFLWGLASWNQGSDDLRGVDPLAIAGNAGPLFGAPNASDGLVSLTSASLGFASGASRIRILPYCHTNLAFLASLLRCLARGIANVDDAPETGQIILSFLADTAVWTTIGTAPAQDPYLSQFGGVYFALDGASGQRTADLSEVSIGSVRLTNGGTANTVFYTELVKDAGTFQAVSASLGTQSCGPFTPAIGFYTVFRCKNAPVISSITPLVQNVSGRLAPSGASITINGMGFGAQRCPSCTVTAFPGGAALQISSWTDQAINALLPAAFSGLTRILVQTVAGSDSINFMALPPPAQSTVSVTSVSNAAGGAAGALAPGELVTIKGTGLGPAAGASFIVNPATGSVDTTLAGTRVFFGNFAAPVTYASAAQVNAMVPYEVAGQLQASMQVEYQGVRSAGTLAQIAKAAPAAFTFNSTGAGQAVAANQDGSLNGPGSPAAKGSYVTIYFTGGGQTNPPGVTGSVTGSVLKRLTQDTAVAVGGQPAAVTFVGAAPGLVDGVGQLNIRLADNTPSGVAVPLVITVGGVRSPATATLAVQ